MSIRIDKITAIEDYRKLPAIQQSAWGFSDLDAEPHQLMTRMQKYGGLVTGIWLDDRLVGFTYALIGRWQGEYFIYSHMLAVEADHQEKGFGFSLKSAQRDEVLKMGYRVIRWNFDPLEATNSFFNIHRLGVVVDEYETNIYGDKGSGLHKGLPTDRAIALWILDSARVEERMQGKSPRHRVDPGSIRIHDFSSSPAHIEIPRDIRWMKKAAPAEALEWRMQTRRLFQEAFKSGFTATEIVFSQDDKRMFYRLEKI